jgi:hypothetical protein
MKRNPKLKPKTERQAAGDEFVLGRARFAKISAVEGISLTPAARGRAAKFDRQGLPPEERVRRILAVHRKP